VLAGVEARDDLARHLEDEFDLELLREAMLRASKRVEPLTWQAFRLVVEDGLSSHEAARRLGVRVAKVYVAKSRVQALVKLELQALEGCPAVEDPPEGA
jgi:DNA-directed RNA polymerase specialized sigma24 family protein